MYFTFLIFHYTLYHAIMIFQELHSRQQWVTLPIHPLLILMIKYTFNLLSFCHENMSKKLQQIEWMVWGKEYNKGRQSAGALKSVNRKTSGATICDKVCQKVWSNPILYAYETRVFNSSMACIVQTHFLRRGCWVQGDDRVIRKSWGYTDESGLWNT